MRALHSEHPRKMTTLGHVPHPFGYRPIYHSIALGLGYTLVLKSHIGSKVMAKNVNFSERKKWTFSLLQAAVCAQIQPEKGD